MANKTASKKTAEKKGRDKVVLAYSGGLDTSVDIHWLKENYSCDGLVMLKRQISRDGTRKYLFQLSDGSNIESVLMHYDYGDCICVTSEVGCNMGCTFCASGLLKKKRWCYRYWKSRRT